MSHDSITLQELNPNKFEDNINLISNYYNRIIISSIRNKGNKGYKSKELRRK